MLCTVISGALIGVSAYLVTVEVDVSQGLPGFSMVGSLSGEVRESKERTMVLLKNLGFNLPPRRITVNLSPADIRKEGSAYDLPIAIGLLNSFGVFSGNPSAGILFLGELSLDGKLKKANGCLPIVREAYKNGIRECIVPRANAAEASVITGMKVRGADTFTQILQFLMEDNTAFKDVILPFEKTDYLALFQEGQEDIYPDFSEVCGQEAAKRAAEIAAAGFHNLLMVGPPGAGKSMIAGRIPGILPPLSFEESLEVTTVASVAGRLEEGQALIKKRPFLSPHTSVSLPALVGGNLNPKPGIISLAHRGVLFLDEMPEFNRYILDSLRQPLEEHKVHISRVGGNVTFPSDFMLVCAMNPCPCGFYPDRNRCKCTEPQIRKYMGKVSGPILDRIDLCVELQSVDINGLSAGAKAESSKTIRDRVLEARKVQQQRFQKTKFRFNSDIDAAHMDCYCALGTEEKALAKKLYQSLHLSARSYHRIIKVARTIADLDGKENIEKKHLTEAAFYRPSSEYWGI